MSQRRVRPSPPPRETPTQQAQNKAEDMAFQKGLPSNPDAERFLLGSVMINAETFEKMAGVVGRDHFSLEKHRRIFAAMEDLNTQNVHIDRVSLADELMKRGQLESVDGLSYLMSLDEGLPDIRNIDGYARIVREKADLRTIIFECQRKINLALEEAAPAQEIAQNLTAGLSDLYTPQGDSDGRSPEQIVETFPGGVGAFLDPTLRKKGQPTSFRRLDEMLGGGLQDGELIIVAARPAVGKSSFMLNVCQNISLHPRRPKRTDVFSLEMSAAALITRMLCAVAHVDNKKFRAGYLGKEERAALQKALDKILNSPLRIHDDFKKNLPAMVRRIRAAHKKGSRLIAIDYAQLMVTGSKSENRNLEIGEIGRTLKLTALELNIPIILVSQIGRSAERRGGEQRPQLSDLKDSGTLEEHADTVLALYREELVKRGRDDNRGLADLDILKQRNGECGRIPLSFIGGWTSFRDRTDGTEFPEQPEDEDPEPEPPAPMPEQEDW